MKKIIFAALLIMSLSLCACGRQEETDMIFEVNSQIEDRQITGSNIWTNTTKITVSADSALEDTEILLFLYNAEELDNPILYATLSKENSKVDFTNLTSACEYRIGAEIRNSSENVILKITD